MADLLTLRNKILSGLPELDSDLLLAYAIQQDRTFVHAHPDYRLSWLQQWRLHRAAHIYRRGDPLAYILGYKEFYGLDFLVNHSTLVPRPDTEILVEEALKVTTQNSLLIDVGTGSGCIPVAIAKTTQPKKIIATDISAKALRVAEQNAKQHDIVITFVHGNLLEPIQITSPAQFSSIIITANLPYLTNEQFQSESSIQREPKSALVAAEGGLALYRQLFEQIKAKQLVRNVIVLAEIDPSQSTSFTILAAQHFPTARVVIKKDLAKRDRVAMVSW